MPNEPNEEPIHLMPTGHMAGGEELSVVVPAMNEELTVGEFVDWCKEGLADAGVRGQILIVDSSTDKTPEIALQRGAEVLRTPPRGLGRAYIDAIPFIRGKWIVMGDADLT
jgi:glycosyltransferase involved in cell wall biosynthesis